MNLKGRPYYTTSRIVAKTKDFLRKLGPGVVTGAADDDPSGLAAYSQAGAKFGLSTLWTALVSAPLMIAIQEMCARAGVVTKRGLASVIKRHYSKTVLYLIILLTVPAIVLNIGADIAAVGAVSNMLVPQVPGVLFSVIFTAGLAAVLIKYPYRKFASLMKWLCISLFAYFVVPFLINVNWGRVLTATLLPTISSNLQFILIIVAVLGTTISPYLFFWQASMEVEESEHRHKHVNRRIMKDMNLDVIVGMVFSNVVMFFIILTAGTVLFTAGINNISTVQDAALALRPLAGNASYLLFALGVIGSACIAIPILAGSISYIYADLSDSMGSLDKKFRQAKGFYIAIVASLAIGLLIDLVGISPITMLIYTAVLYGLTAPVMVLLILHMCNDRSVLGKYVNGKLSNVLGIATFVVMALAAGAFLILQFL